MSIPKYLLTISSCEILLSIYSLVSLTVFGFLFINYIIKKRISNSIISTITNPKIILINMRQNQPKIDNELVGRILINGVT